MESASSSRPQYFYKYMPFNDHDDRVNWIKEIITCGTIFVPSADSLNDPFEQCLSSESDSTESLSGIEKLKIILQWQARQKSVGVLSVSTDWSNLLMWAHYASSHKGICIEFLNNGDSFQPVEYVSSFPTESDDFFLVKSKHWEYEKEYRFVTQKVDQKINLQEIGLSVNSIILGANFKEHDLFANKIYPVLNKRSFAKIKTSLETFELSQFPLDEKWFAKILALRDLQKRNS